MARGAGRAGPGGITLDITMLPSSTIIMGELSRFAGAFRSVGPVLNDAIDDVVIPRIESNFDNEQEASGKKWEELSPWTPIGPYRTEHNAPNAPILNVTGALKGGATNRANWDVNNQSGEAVLNDIPEAPFWRTHQFGSVENAAGYGEVPPRPFADITDEDVDQIAEMFQEYIGTRMAARAARGLA